MVVMHALLAVLLIQLQLGRSQVVTLTVGSSKACFNITNLHLAETCQGLHSACCP